MDLTDELMTAPPKMVVHSVVHTVTRPTCGKSPAIIREGFSKLRNHFTWRKANE